VALLVAVAGCGKKDVAPPPTAATAPAEPAPATDPAAPPEAPQPGVAVPPVRVEGAVDAFMTEQLRIFVQQKGRMPNDFNELRSTRLDGVPRTPAGLKWVIDTTTQEVKLTKQ